MSTDRMTRVNALLRREIGEVLFTTLTEPDVDLSAITVTQVIASPNLRSAVVRVSIRETPERKTRALRALQRHRVEIQGRINKDCGLKYTPRLAFEVDESIQKGDHILEILSRMPGADADATESPPT